MKLIDFTITHIEADYSYRSDMHLKIFFRFHHEKQDTHIICPFDLTVDEDPDVSGSPNAFHFGLNGLAVITPEEDYSDEKIKSDLFDLVFPYLRSTVAAITGAAGMSQILLPFPENQ